VGKAPGPRAWLLLEVSKREVFALQSRFPLSGLCSYASTASSVVLLGKKMEFPCSDAAVVGCVHRHCILVFSPDFSEALWADDHHILPAASPGSSPSPASPAVPAPYEHGSPLPGFTASRVTPSQASPSPF